VAFGSRPPVRPLLEACGGGGHPGCWFAAQPASGDRQEAPKAWDDSKPPARYTAEDIATWRAAFGFARRQHSLASIGYTDDELLDWRKPFDALAVENRICYSGFEELVLRTYQGVIPEEELQQKVRFFWEKFDADRNNCVDFGEFIDAGLIFNLDFAKEKIRKEGIEATFLNYADENFMAESDFIQLMCDHHFFAVTPTDVRKIMRLVDQDCDGLISLSDFSQWVKSADLEVGPQKPSRRRGPAGARRGRVVLPPPEPEG